MSVANDMMNTAKQLRGTERECHVGERPREEREEHRRDERADERREERGRQRECRFTELLREGEAVEQKHDGPRLARDVEQDRGDHAAEQRAPVDAGKEDDRARRSAGAGVRDEDRDRQQDRHATGAAETGEDADDQAEEASDRQEQQVERL
jgi:hypothetical protein